MNSSSQTTILLVEDEEIFWVVQIIFLESCGYKVLHASGSQKAIEFIQSDPLINLVLMDIDLGESKDGTDLAAEILEIREIPIIFLSSHSDIDTKNKAKKISSYGFILKHTALAILDTSIEMALNLFSERKNAKQKDEALKETTNKLRKAHVDLLQRQFAIDQHAIVAITNLAGTILYVNNRFCEISQYSYNELVGNNHRLINSGFHPKEFWTQMYGTLKQGNVWHGEIRNRAKDGSIYWVATTIAPLENADGKIAEYLALRTVITERKLAEENLRLHQIELENQKAELERAYSKLELTQVRYFDLYDFAPVGYLTVNEEGEILEANLTFAAMLGYNRESLIEKQFSQFTIAGDRDICHYHRQQMFQTGNAQSFEIRIQRIDGTIFWAKLDTNLRKDEKGTPNCRIAVTDFSKRKELEMKLQEYMKVLENVNRTKDKFFNIIAHDLRNPFSGIIGIADLLEVKLREDKSNLPHEYIQYTRMIQTASRSAFTLLENLLLWARSQTGDISFRPRQITINHLISVTIPLVVGNAFKKSITIETILSEEISVFGDEFFVSTIIRNLLTNAIKFTSHGGQVIVSAVSNNDFAEISVTDTGIGITPEHLEAIFRIDSKISKVGTDKEKGSGLGLILCKDFVEKHGGTIWVTSQLGVGSRFTFTVPLATKKINVNSSLPISS